MSQAEMIGRLVERRGTVVLIGGIDTGKTSFALTLTEAARAAGVSVAYVDADISQSTVGPPMCVGMKVCDELACIDPNSMAEADGLAFVGSISPDGHALELLAGTVSLVHRARESGCEMVVVDTSRLVSGYEAEMLKHHKLELTAPASVLGFQRGGELEPVLAHARRFTSAEVSSLKVDPAVLERSIEDRISARERRLESYFAPPLGRWRVKTTVFMPAIPPDLDEGRLDGMVVGVHDSAGRCLGIGVLEYDRTERVLRMLSPVKDQPSGLRLGSTRLATDGRLLGRVDLRELLGAHAPERTE